VQSFQLFKYSPPEKTDADYSEEQKEQYREAFKPIAKRHRIFGYLILISAGFGFLLLSLPKPDYRLWLFFGVFSIIFIGIFCSLLFGPLCPACQRKIDDQPRAFCPECGGKVRHGNFLTAPKCYSCGIALRRGKRRSYKIRCCTHCGVFLDAKGI